MPHFYNLARHISSCKISIAKTYMIFYALQGLIQMVFPAQRVDFIPLMHGKAFRMHLPELLFPFAKKLRLRGFEKAAIDLFRYKVF